MTQSDLQVGTVGGNLGMFVGMSAMTVLEWLELLVFSIIAAPFFLLRRSSIPCVRTEDESEGGVPAASDSVSSTSTHKAILSGMAVMALRRKAAKVKCLSKSNSGQSFIARIAV